MLTVDNTAWRSSCCCLLWR